MTLPDILNVKNALVNVVHHWQPCRNFFEVFIFAPADKTTITQSLRTALSVGLEQVSAFATLKAKYGNRTVFRKVVFYVQQLCCFLHTRQQTKIQKHIKC